MPIQIGPKYTFRRNKAVEADGVFIGWISRTRDGYFVVSPKGTERSCYGVSRPVAAGTLRQLAEEEQAALDAMTITELHKIMKDPEQTVEYRRITNFTIFRKRQEGEK